MQIPTIKNKGPRGKMGLGKQESRTMSLTTGKGEEGGQGRGGEEKDKP